VRVHVHMCARDCQRACQRASVRASVPETSVACGAIGGIKADQKPDGAAGAAGQERAGQAAGEAAGLEAGEASGLEAGEAAAQAAGEKRTGKAAGKLANGCSSARGIGVPGMIVQLTNKHRLGSKACGCWQRADVWLLWPLHKLKCCAADKPDALSAAYVAWHTKWPCACVKAMSECMAGCYASCPVSLLMTLDPPSSLGPACHAWPSAVSPGCQ
jgi:hypothetical protein